MRNEKLEIKKIMINYLSCLTSHLSPRKSAGFTLVELLASVIVLVAVGSVIAGIMTATLRGTNKTNTIENIRQNGSYAINQVSKDIEYTLPFDGKNTGLSNDDGATYATSCPFSLSPTPIPEVTTYNLITVESASNIVTKYKCTSTPVVLSANGTSLVDLTSVSLKSCSFTCIQSKATDIPIIKINFSIGPKGSSVLVENSNPPIVFETSVTIRNYKK